MWQPKATAADKGISEGDTIRVIFRGLGGMMNEIGEQDELGMDNDEDEEERRYRILQEQNPGRVIRPSEFHKRQRIHQGTMDSFLTPQSSTLSLSSPPNVTMTEASTNDSIYTAEWESTQVDEEMQPPPARDPAKDIKTNYQKDPFTRTFFYKKIPAMNLTETQRKEITQLKIDQISKMINMSVLARTIQVGPLRMSQIPDVVKAIHQMGYSIDVVPTVMRQIETNQHHTALTERNQTGAYSHLS
jgi:hypothetical protein